LIDGIDIKQYDLDILRRSIGFVLQETILFSGTIKDNLRWGKEDASEDEIIEACKASQAQDFPMDMKHNLVRWGSISLEGKNNALLLHGRS
jgi:ATP-binding cassette subfamily B multidrug efflux pump